MDAVGSLLTMRPWTEEKKAWIQVIVDLFEQMFGGDFLSYIYDREHGTKVAEHVTSSLSEYCHEHWESHIGSYKEPPEDKKHLCLPAANTCTRPLVQQPFLAQQSVPSRHLSPAQWSAPTQQPGPAQHPAPTQHNSHCTQSSHH